MRHTAVLNELLKPGVYAQGIDTPTLSFTEFGQREWICTSSHIHSVILRVVKWDLTGCRLGACLTNAAHGLI